MPSKKVPSPHRETTAGIIRNHRRSGLFSPINMAATQAKDDMVIMVTEHLKATLQDWRAIVNSFRTTPTLVELLLAAGQTTLITQIHVALETGGVATPGLNSIHYKVWQLEWPEDIKEMM